MNSSCGKQKKVLDKYVEKVFSRYAANLQENNHAEVRFATLLKSHFGMSVLL